MVSILGLFSPICNDDLSTPAAVGVWVLFILLRQPSPEEREVADVFVRVTAEYNLIRL